MAFLTELWAEKARLAAQPTDPWAERLQRVRGNVGDDGIERLTTQQLFDALELRQCARGAGLARRLARVMRELGWTPLRMRDLTRGGYKENVRGYCRDTKVKR
ncbi:MAG TPA: hypothetical protein VIJ79_17335 [Acidobacteriaceae bacterium]